MLTINLLSPKKRREAMFRQYFYPLKTALELLLITALVTAMVTIGAKLFLLNTLLDVAGSPTVNIHVRELETHARTVNYQTALFERLDQKSVSWSPLLRLLAEHTPETIRVSELSIKQEAPPHLLLKGTAATRDALLTWKETIENLPIFTTLSFPLANFLIAEETPWQLEAHIDFTELHALEENERTPL